VGGSARLAATSKVAGIDRDADRANHVAWGRGERVEHDRYAREAEPAGLVDHTSPSDPRRSARNRRPAYQDPLGSSREAASKAGDFRPYATAFAEIDSDPAQLPVVATDGMEVVATLQLSFIPGLARRGALRA